MPFLVGSPEKEYHSSVYFDADPKSRLEIKKFLVDMPFLVGRRPLMPKKITLLLKWPSGTSLLAKYQKATYDRRPVPEPSPWGRPPERIWDQKGSDIIPLPSERTWYQTGSNIIPHLWTNRCKNTFLQLCWQAVTSGDRNLTYFSQKKKKKIAKYINETWIHTINWLPRANKHN